MQVQRIAADEVHLAVDQHPQGFLLTDMLGASGRQDYENRFVSIGRHGFARHLITRLRARPDRSGRLRIVCVGEGNKKAADSPLRGARPPGVRFVSDCLTLSPMRLTFRFPSK